MNISLDDNNFSFLDDTVTFSLLARTSGGPPENYTWTRDGVEIGENHSIALFLNSSEVFRESLYYSNLTISERLPGVYQFSVTNRDTPTPQSQNFTIEGAQHVVNDSVGNYSNFRWRCSD